MTAHIPDLPESIERSRETSGERLVRIETLLAGMTAALNAHMRDGEREMAEMRSEIRDHLKGSTSLGEDVRQMSKDVHAMSGRLSALETEVATLVKSKLTIVSWAAGAGAVVSLLWFVIGDSLKSGLHMSGPAQAREAPKDPVPK
jgi:hypothetical protein